jgi:hypothetical protein
MINEELSRRFYDDIHDKRAELIRIFDKFKEQDRRAIFGDFIMDKFHLIKTRMLYYWLSIFT